MVGVAPQIPTITDFRQEPFDGAESGQMFVLELVNGRYVKISAPALRILHALKSASSYQEASQSLAQQGVDVSVAELIKLSHGPFTEAGIMPGRPVARDFDLWIHAGLVDGKRFAWIKSYTAWLFNTWVTFIAVLAAIVISFYGLLQSAFISGLTLASLFDFPIFPVFGLIALGAIVHELGHLAASYAMGVIPRKIGVGIYMFKPVLFGDLSPMWLRPRRERIVTDFGGMYFQLLFCIGLSVGAVVINHEIFILALLFTAVGIILNLNPFLRYDGYWILSDLLGFTNVHKRGMSLIRKSSKDTSNGGLIAQQKKVYFLFTLGYMCVTVAAILAGLIAVMRGLVNPQEAWSNVSPFFQALAQGDPLQAGRTLLGGGLLLPALLYSTFLVVIVARGIVNDIRDRIAPSERLAV